MNTAEGKLYSASSLEDIAKLFDMRANTCSQQASRTNVNKDAALANRESRTWRAAADVLRSTDLRVAS